MNGRVTLLSKTLKAVLLASVALTGVALAGAVPAQAETLEEALAMAYQNNPTLLAARAALRSVDESVPIALSGWRPSLNLNGNVARTRSETNIIRNGTGGAVFGGGTTLRTSQTAAAQLVQPLFDGFGTVAATSQANANVKAQRARLQASEAQVLTEAVTSYVGVLRDQAVVELRRNNVQVLTRQFDATNDRFRVGEITRTDVAQSEARLAGAKADLITAEGNLQKSRAAYQNNVGKAPETLTPPPAAKGLPATAEEAVSLALKNNPAFVAANYTAEAAQDQIDVTRSDLLPSVQLEASYQKGWNTVADVSRAETAQARAVLTVPLYQSGAEYARLRQSKHQAGQRRLEADQARDDARETSTAAFETYQSATASLESLRSQIKASEIALEGVQREAEVGSRTVLDVLDAEQELLNARVNLVTAESNQITTSYQLLSALGQLTAQNIGLKVDVYDPSAHFDDVKYQAFGGNKDAEADAKAGKK
ncbi:MAG: TolC family outer membrane protein [Rhodospirillaceae bacterium]|nr:TolC family outer membrane protein [Rhodospirillaceae bacterium]